MKKILACILTFAMLFVIAVPGTAFAAADQKIKLTDAIDKAKTLLDINTDNYNFTYNYNESTNGSSNGISAWQLSWNSKKTNGGGMSVSVNSETGDITNYYNWDPYTIQSTVKIPKYSKQNALDAVVKFLNKAVPTKFSQMVLKDNSNLSYGIPITSDTYNFNYVRQVNGLDFLDN